MDCISDQENSDLTRSVFMVEICEALWSLGEDKASRLDDFPSFFFYRYWSIIGGEVIEVVQAVFYSDGIPTEWKKTLITHL